MTSQNVAAERLYFVATSRNGLRNFPRSSARGKARTHSAGLTVRRLEKRLQTQQNYRSTQPILVVANAVIDFASERFTKNLWSDRPASDLPALVNVADDNAQAGYIVEAILANREAGIGLKSQAVLFRALHHSATLEVELTRRNIPFVKFGGLKFLEAAHVKEDRRTERRTKNFHC